MGLLKPTKGEVHIGDRVIEAGKKAKEFKANPSKGWNCFSIS